MLDVAALARGCVFCGALILVGAGAVCGWGQDSVGRTDRLIGTYALNEGKGKVVHDQSANGCRGGIYFAEWVFQGGASFLEFVAPASWVDIPNGRLNFSGAFSIELWVCPADLSGERLLVSNGVAWMKEGYEFALEDGQMRFALNTDQGFFRAAGRGNDLKPKEWTHLAAVYDPGIRLLRLYENGSRVAEVSAAGTLKPYARYRGNLCLGAVASGTATARHESNGQFLGFLRDVRFHGAALTQQEVRLNYEENKANMKGQCSFKQERLERERSGTLSLEVVDEEGRPAGARIHVKAGGKYQGPKRLFYHQTAAMTDPAYFYALNGRCVLPVPPGKVEVWAVHGPEYFIHQTSCEIGANEKKTLQIKLERMVKLADRGWFGGDHHVHCGTHGARQKGLQPVWEELCQMAESEGLAYLNVAEPGSERWTTEKLIAKKNGIEGRSHFDLGGHVHYLNAANGEPPSRKTFAFLEAKRLKTAACMHGHGAVVARDMAAVPFAEGRMLMDVWMVRDDLRAWMCFNNVGIKLPISAGSDHDANVFVGTDRPALGGKRLYLRLGKLDWDEVVEAYREGRSFATSGPLLFCEVEGVATGGTVMLPEKGGVLRVKVEAHAAQGIEKIELLQNGEIVRSWDGNGRGAAVESLTLPVDGSGWFCAHCIAKKSDFMGNEAFTSPIYLQVGRCPVMPREPDLSFLLKWVDDYKNILPAAREKRPALDVAEIDECLDRLRLFYESLRTNPQPWEGRSRNN
ncbi:MAG: CehA/McbA family metallohydrolase [Verrucomicrobiae bacterium]|nr:CehA/McbA family metallohydrolase [Verrucomicrobiae bacterium]